MTTAYDFTATNIDGEEIDLGQYRGKPLLIVNTASQCAFTPQYTGLEELNKAYADQGLVVLGFPCNQFGHQEPGDADAIKSTCSLTYDVTFPMFSKVDVNGKDAHPLFAWLRSEKSTILGNRIKWNFTKFLVDKQGQVVDRFPPTAKPESLTARIEKVL